MASYWDWIPKVLPAVIGAGVTLYGAKQASDSNNAAAATVNQGMQQSTEAQTAAIQAAQNQINTMQRQASPGLVAMQGVIGRGTALTPAQQQALDDARRTTIDALQGGDLRGSAGATVAAVRDVEGRMRGDFMSQNQNRADTAATALSGQYFNQGKNSADLDLSRGATVSQGLMSNANVNAANTMGQATIKGQAIGDIGAIIADEAKRHSSYQTVGGNRV